MKFFRIKNWDEFQHYKDRSPPWIKLYNHLLDDYSFSCLPDASKAHLVMIWLLASRNDNKLPCDSKWISSRINSNEDVDLNLFLNLGFIEIFPIENNEMDTCYTDASIALQAMEQDAIPEKRREESEESKEEDKKHISKSRVKELDYSSWPEVPDPQILKDWLSMRKRKKADVSQTVLNSFGKQLHKAREAGLSVDECLSECITRSWTGFKVEWITKVQSVNTNKNTKSFSEMNYGDTVEDL